MYFLGRGRAEGSQSVLLTQEKWIADKEEANQQREKLMLEALDRIAGKGTEWFEQQVRFVTFCVNIFCLGEKITFWTRDGRLKCEMQVALAQSEKLDFKFAIKWTLL